MADSVLVSKIVQPTLNSATVSVAPKAAQKAHASHWHNREFNDPWFWLREKENPEVMAYLAEENRFTAEQTKGVQDFADALYGEMLGRIKQTDLSVPYRIGIWLYYSRTEEGRQYKTYCRRPVPGGGEDSAKEAEQVLLDLNILAEGLEFLELGSFEVSDDAKRLFYSVDTTGFRQYDLFQKNLEDGVTSKVLAQRVTSVAPGADNQMVYYTTEDPVTKRSNQLWRITGVNESPELLFEEKDELYRLDISRSRDKAFLFLGIVSTDTWEQRLMAVSAEKAVFKTVLPRQKGHKYSVDHRGGLLFIRTNKGAKNFRLVTAPLDNTDEDQWKVILGHDPEALLEDFQLFESHLVVQTKSEGMERMRVFDFKSGEWSSIEMPEAVYSASLAPNPEYKSGSFRFSYQSMVTPPSVYEINMESKRQTLLKQQEVLGGYDRERYATRRVWAVASDGAKVPLSLVFEKGFEGKGTGPCLLYGYGAYGLGMPSHFSSSRISLLDRGMVYAIAHVRGGDEMGEEWHDAGMLMRKKNTFNDFIDSAEWLIREGWTSSDQLVIQGESAGGLLMGAVTNARPDLFKAVHAGVPFVDMMNTMMDASLPLTVGEYLEWGDPNEEGAFRYMLSYSPYDNLRAGNYPAMLVTTSLNDSQVMYWEPAKFVAKLRTLKTDQTPLHLKCNMGAGHGGASGRYDQLKEEAFEMAWLMWQLGITR